MTHELDLSKTSKSFQSSLPILFCKEHKQQQITHLSISQSNDKKVFCSKCLETNNYNNIIDLQKAVDQLGKIQTASESHFVMAEQWYQNFWRISKSIIQIYENQIQDVVYLQERIKSIIEKEKNEILTTFRSIEKLNKQELDKFVEILIDFYNNSNIGGQQIQRNFGITFTSFRDSISKKKEEKLIEFENLEMIIKDFSHQLSEEAILIQKSIYLNQISLLECSQNNNTVFSTVENNVNIYKSIKDQFQQIQSIETNHQMITALALDEKKNKIYIAGEDNTLTIWQWQTLKAQYELEKKIIINEKIFHIIIEKLNSKIITISKENISVWDQCSTCKLQKLNNMEKQDILLEINCADINFCGLILICNFSNQICLWNQCNQWIPQDQITSQQHISMRFINNLQFVSSNKQGVVQIWEVNCCQIFLISSFLAISGNLLYCKNINALICYNNSAYQIFKKQKINSFSLFVEKSGQNIRLCISESGEYLVVFNLGYLRLCLTEEL